MTSVIVPSITKLFELFLEASFDFVAVGNLQKYLQVSNRFNFLSETSEFGDCVDESFKIVDAIVEESIVKISSTKESLTVQTFATLLLNNFSKRQKKLKRR